MKIAHVAPFFCPEIGGMESAVLSQCRGLVKMGNEVHVYTCNRFRNGKKIRKKKDIVENIFIHYVNSILHIEKAHLFPSLFRELIKEDFEIIHTHAIHHPHNDIAAFAGKLKRKKIVFTSHSSFFPKNVVPSYQFYLFYVYDALARFSIFRTADRIIALTPYDKKELIKRDVKSKKIRIIPNGVEDKYFDFHDGNYFKEKYDLDGKIILNVGRLNKIKRLDILVKALPLVIKENPSLKLVLVGQDEGYYNYLKELSEQFGVKQNVIWLGTLSEDDKLAAYSACDIFCLPSDTEPFGIVLLEAQAMGKPAIATMAGGVPYVVKNGETGLLVPPRDYIGFAHAINSLLSDNHRRKKMGHSAKKWASNFKWEFITRNIFDVYQELVN